MDAKDALPQLNSQILEEAGYWLVELNSEAADPGLQTPAADFLVTMYAGAEAAVVNSNQGQFDVWTVPLSVPTGKHLKRR